MKLHNIAPGTFASPTQSIAPKSAPQESAPAPQADQAAAEGQASEAERDWTVLLYLNGNNAQSSDCVSTLRQLEYVFSNDKNTMVAQLARPKALLDRWSKDWNGVRRYEIKHNGEKLTPSVLISEMLTSRLPGRTKGITSPVVEDLGQADMGKAETLEDFLKWGMEKYPAKHYMVVTMGPSEGISGMMHDTVSGSNMKVSDLGQALKNVHEKTGKKIDVLNLAGSATNTMEVAYELKDHAKFLVGSQGLLGGNFPTSMVLNEIQNANATRPQTPEEVAGYLMLMNSMAGGTLSALDLEKIGAVKESWNTLSQALLDANISGEKLCSLLDATQDFQGRSTNEAYQNSRDAIHFAKLVKDDAEITDPKVKAAAEAAIASIEGAIVGDVAGGKYTAEAHGLSIFGPTHYGFFRPDGAAVPENFVRTSKYEETSFAKETAWDEVLAKAGKDSTFNSTLKKLGFSEHSIDRLYAANNKHGGKVKGALGLASMVGYMNGMNVMRGSKPLGGDGLGVISGYVGAAGAVNDAVKGIGEMVYAGSELKDGDEIAHQAFNVGQAVAKGVANLGASIPALQPYAQTAGTLMFISPWLKDFYGIYENYKGIRDGYQLSLSSSKAPITEQWGAATVQFFENKNLNDHHERSLWQKLAG